MSTFDRAARVLAVAFAACAWIVVGAIAVDELGGGVAAEHAAAARSTDPCSLREPLGVGTDVRCAFQLARAEGSPFAVDLDQRWEANVLVQRLSVRDGAAHPLYALATRSAGPQASRLQRLFAVPGGDGTEHLAFVLGLCGGLACGASEVWILDPVAGGVAPLAKLAVAQSPVVDLRADGTLEVVESADRLGIGTLLIRTLRWEGGHYRVESATRQRVGPR